MAKRKANKQKPIDRRTLNNPQNKETLKEWKDIRHTLIETEDQKKEQDQVRGKVAKKKSRLAEVKRFGKVLKVEQFRRDPIGTIRTHLENTLS